MSNPFKLRWLKGWHFQIVLMNGGMKIEAHGYGVCLRTELLQGESPTDAADRLVLFENHRREGFYNNWFKSNILNSIQSYKYKQLSQLPQKNLQV